MTSTGVHAWTHFGRNASWTTTPPRTLDLDPQGKLGPQDIDLQQSTENSADADTRLSEMGVVPLADATGDGRPEIGLPSTTSRGLAVFASQTIALGTATQVPFVQTSPIKDDIAALEAAFAGAFAVLEQPDGSDAGDVPETGAAASSCRSRRPALIRSAPQGGRARRQINRDASAIERNRRCHVHAARRSHRGSRHRRDRCFDPISNESLLRTIDERCLNRRCIQRFRRIDAAGRVLASVSVRSDADGLHARFTNDGPDTDAKLDVLIHDDQSGPGSEDHRRGLGGTVAVWPSVATGASNLSALSALGDGASLLLVGGTLARRTAPDGTRFHGGHVLRGKGRKRSEIVALVAAPR